MLKDILHSPDVQAAALFCLSACLGQFLHFVKKWAEGQEWVLSNLRRTIGAAIGNIGGMVVFIQTGVLGPLMALPNGMFAVAMFGFINGFSLDSALNKGTKKIWTDEERAAAAEKGT